MIHFRAVDRPRSGEVVQWQQLASAVDGNLVYHVPDDGTLVYQVQTVIGFQTLIDDVPALCRRRGDTHFVVCGMPAQEHIGIVLPVLMALKPVAKSWSTYMQQQADILAKIGISAKIIPMNERAYRRNIVSFTRSVIYTGFYWAEKRLDQFCDVARLMPDWDFTLHIGQDVPIADDGIPSNVQLDNAFRSAWGSYMQLVSSHEYVFIPRTESPMTYIGRSGLSAVASGAIAVLPDVGPNAYLPKGTCVKYRADATAAEIADLLQSRPTVDRSAIDTLLAECDPGAVCHLILDQK